MTTLNGFTFRNKNRHETRDAARRWVLGLVFATLVAAPLMAQDWPMFGQNLANTANSVNTQISVNNVNTLRPKWTFTTGGDVSARAAVVNSIAYFPDWGGNLWAVNATNGQLIWGHQFSDYGLPANTHSRTSPALTDNGGTLYIGTQEGAWLLAINAKTGALVWKTELETTDPYAIITTSPAVSGSVVYTGVASIAEGASTYGVNMSTAVARGSVVAVDANKGAIHWKTYTVPVGYIGGGVWGSNPVVDVARKTVFIGTGDNYAHPHDDAPSSNPNLTYGQCISEEGTEANCLSPDDHVDSILALDMNTGAVKWSRKMVTWNQYYEPVNGYDDWNVDCLLGGTQCPTNPAAGPDYDFGSAPNEITYKGSDGKFHTVIGAGQKSGIYYALDPDTGATLWQTQVGPGSALGGIEWGSASDGQRIYVAIADLFAIGYPKPYTGPIYAGSWSALDPATGNILWQTADPNSAVDIGPMAVANGVVYGSSMAGAVTAPTMFALNAATGNILWNFTTGVSVNAGATIVNGVVYWGSGYTHLHFPGQTGGNNTFYAFSQNGN
jgi:polyvinyl alcohol dehydrogenase (cytochrome)